MWLARVYAQCVGRGATWTCIDRLSVSECLNREWLLNLREARVVIEDWRQKYNMERPHSRLGYLSPERFIANQKVSP